MVLALTVEENSAFPVPVHHKECLGLIKLSSIDLKDICIDQTTDLSLARVSK